METLRQKKATGLRLCSDQRERLDFLVRLTGGRKDRSVLIREAIDSYLETKLPRMEGEPIRG